MPETSRNFIETLLIPTGCCERFLPLEEACARPLREHGVIHAGLSELRPPFDIARQAMPFHVILYTISGGARIDTATTQSAVGPGDLWIGPLGHDYRCRAGAHWKVLWFHLADSDCWRALHERPIGVHLTLPLRALCHATDEFLSESIHAEGGAFQAAWSYAEIIGVYLDRLVGEERPATQAREHFDLHAFWTRVDADLAFGWTVDSMAARLHVSTTHLHRLVARHYRATPMQMVARLRMRRAGEMLRGSNDTIERIALAIGYSSSVSFSKAFARHFGLSPGKFRSTSHRMDS